MSYECYGIVIYKHNNADVYDVEINITADRIKPSNDEHRAVVYDESHYSTKFISADILTAYFKRKFEHCQFNTDTHNVVSRPDYYTCICNSLEWIISIVEVEIDYHLGRRDCLLLKNKRKLFKYKKFATNGYGVTSAFRNGVVVKK